MGQTINKEKEEPTKNDKIKKKLLEDVLDRKITIQQVPVEFQDFYFLEKCILGGINIYQNISEKMKENYEIATLSVLKNRENYNFIPESLKKDEYFHIRFLQHYKSHYEYFNDDMKKNPNVAIEAMKQS
jgi:hypothetical protein